MHTCRDLKLDDLLEKQKDNVAVLDLEYVNLSVNKLMGLLNKSVSRPFTGALRRELIYPLFSYSSQESDSEVSWSWSSSCSHHNQQYVALRLRFPCRVISRILEFEDYVEFKLRK